MFWKSSNLLSHLSSKSDKPVKDTEIHKFKSKLYESSITIDTDRQGMGQPIQNPCTLGYLIVPKRNASFSEIPDMQNNV